MSDRGLAIGNARIDGPEGRRVLRRRRAAPERAAAE